MQTKSSNISTIKPLKGHFFAKRMNDFGNHFGNSQIVANSSA